MSSQRNQFCPHPSDLPLNNLQMQTTNMNRYTQQQTDFFKPCKFKKLFRRPHFSSSNSPISFLNHIFSLLFSFSALRSVAGFFGEACVHWSTLLLIPPAHFFKIFSLVSISFTIFLIFHALISSRVFMTFLLLNGSRIFLIFLVVNKAAAMVPIFPNNS